MPDDARALPKACVHALRWYCTLPADVVTIGANVALPASHCAATGLAPMFTLIDALPASVTFTLDASNVGAPKYGPVVV